MEWSIEVSCKLLEFHKANIEEYRDLLQEFNLYIYGYGYKLDVLKEIFPQLLVVDFAEDESIIISREVYDFYGIEPKENEVKNALLHIKKHIKRPETDKVLVLINAKKEIALECADSFRIILMYHRDITLSLNEMVEYNYIMRDFSTFVFRKSKNKGVEATYRINEVLNVYDCIGPLGKRIFKLALRIAALKGEFSLRELYNKEKKKLLIVSYSTFQEALSGFFDAGILVESNGVCKVNLTKKELGNIIEIICKGN